MKKLTLTVCALTALVSGAYAGTTMSSGKEMKQAVEQQAPCPEWYADNEWNVTVSGVYAPTANEYREDTFLGVDHAWGGAIDAKYFFRRYFGVGIQGFGLATNRKNTDFEDFGFDDDDDGDFAGGFVGTLTLRYPIPCTRFSPYAWVGVGAIFGGNDDPNFDDFDDDDDIDDFITGDDNDGRLMGQYGLGIEVRLTQRIGLTNDLSFNHLEGGRNDFFQVRTGLNFAF
ncbi:MAG TPA: outer membrane beta-barrel protein [Chthoniobacterales bacterium]|nr:outer membrane beta-barrel protein [Chthoniobacterales bacterium]